MLKENSRKVWQYLKDNDGADMTLDDIAAGTGLTSKQVNGCVLGLQREIVDNETGAVKKPSYAVRTEAVIVTDEGKEKKIKFISLTNAGLALDPDAE